jgi:mono/diheme cytochrome c family protein
MKILFRLLVVVVVIIAAAGAFVVSGSYDIGADAPHWSVTEKLIAQVRNRSIAHRSADIVVPDLENEASIRRGAHHYAEMCSSCHLAPGMTQTELRAGLYPLPPDLATHAAIDPREAFWVIKHGVKMSGMSAWGKSHDDVAIWDMVAFIRKLPMLDEKGFVALAGMPGSDGHGGMDDHDHDHDGAHGSESSEDHEHMHASHGG